MKKLLAILIVASIFILPFNSFANTGIYYEAVNLSREPLTPEDKDYLICYDSFGKNFGLANQLNIYFPEGKYINTDSTDYIRLDMTIASFNQSYLGNNFIIRFGTNTGNGFNFTDFSNRSISGVRQTNYQFYEYSYTTHSTPSYNYPDTTDTYFKSTYLYNKTFSVYIPSSYFRNIIWVNITDFFTGSNKWEYLDDYFGTQGQGEDFYVPYNQVLSLKFSYVYSNFDDVIDPSQSSSLINDLNMNKPDISNITDAKQLAGSENVSKVSTILSQITTNSFVLNIMLIVISLAITSYFLYGRKS